MMGYYHCHYSNHAKSRNHQGFDNYPAAFRIHLIHVRRRRAGPVVSVSLGVTLWPVMMMILPSCCHALLPFAMLFSPVARAASLFLPCLLSRTHTNPIKWTSMTLCVLPSAGTSPAWGPTFSQQTTEVIIRNQTEVMIRISLNPKMRTKIIKPVRQIYIEQATQDESAAVSEEGGREL